MIGMKFVFLFGALVLACAANPAGKSYYPHYIRTISEVHIEKGTAGATSELNTAYTAEKGFEHNYAYGWKSKNNYGNAPEMIWYHFRQAFAPAEITFRSNGNVNEVPLKYQFVGTNDPHCNEYSPWTILCEQLSDTNKIVYRYETQRCVVGNHHRQTYTCFGIRVLSTKDNTPYVGVGNIRMWKKEAIVPKE